MNSKPTIDRRSLHKQFDELLLEVMNTSFDCGEHDGNLQTYNEVKLLADAAEGKLRAFVAAIIEGSDK